MARPDLSQLKALLESARLVSVLLPQNPSYDSVASGLALKLSLESLDKSVAAACPDSMTVEFNRLVGVDTITTSITNRDLLITFADQTEHVDKVSYNLEGGQLQLVVTSKPGSPHLDHTRLRFVSGSGKSDLHILVGVDQLLHLGSIYHQAKDIISASPVASLTRQLPAENYTPHQYYDPDTSSLCELVTLIIDSLGLHLPVDAASNLLSGLEMTTQNFQSHLVTVGTFEVAAHLLRQGARRHQAFDPGHLPPGSIPQAPAPSSQLGYGTDSQPVAPPDKADAKEPPPDWYEPKIYQGPMLP